jgi:AraC family transcriptional regulator
MELSRIYNTLNFIEDNYNRQITVKEIENISCYSYRNIQRIFKYTCNETIGSYQIRLKLEKAYKLILYTSDNLTEIAYKVGFESLPAFSKAFKKHFLITPKQAKTEKIALFKKGGINPIESEIAIKPEIVFVPQMKVYYESTKTNYVNNEIELLWDKFSQYDFPQSNVDFYGLIADEPLITDSIKCRYDACCTVQSLNTKLLTKNILGSRYARFFHNGSYSTIDETYRNIYAGWILTSQLEFSNTPIVEQYIKHSTNTDSETNYVTAILLPLKN